ncbi:MAG: C4-type zinc ribbon domain-containing protein [Chloroflexota bacterium]|nr:C4-type zinc ribbon domain-containing protein [Chloroflexota bacterium]
MNDALTLYRLQQLDDQLNQANDRLAEIEAALSDDQRVRKAEKTLAKAEEEAREIRINLRRIEGDVEAQRIKRKTTQAALFGGKIKNPKELQDLQMESEALKRYITKLEDEQLEAMIANESAELAVEQAQNALKQAKGTAVEESAALRGEMSKLEEDVERLSRERDAALKAVSPTSLSLYENLIKTKRGVAVASISDGGCSICGQALPPAEIQAVRKGDALVPCPSCGRILFST